MGQHLPYWKNQTVSIADDINAERCQDEILQPIAIPYLHSLGLNYVLQDDTRQPHRMHVGSALTCFSCQSDQHTLLKTGTPSHSTVGPSW